MLIVCFDFVGVNDCELLLIFGLMLILLRYVIDVVIFEEIMLIGLVGLGFYCVMVVRVGVSVMLICDFDYWGCDFFVSCGFYNFDEIWFDYFCEVNG